MSAPAVPAAQRIFVDGKDVVPDVWEVLDKIKSFSGGCTIIKITGVPECSQGLRAAYSWG
jgi:hypothetical protein